MLGMPLGAVPATAGSPWSSLAAPVGELLAQRLQPLPAPGHLQVLQRHLGLQTDGPVEQGAPIGQLLQPGAAGGVRVVMDTATSQGSRRM